MTKFGFKEITKNNWLEPDPILKGFVRITADRKTESLSGEDFLRHILNPKLIDKVPKDVRALFEVARGALVYGYFFYPLYALAAQQLFRVAEAAVDCKCKDLEAPKSKATFKKKIDWLVDQGTIPKSELERWTAIRELRNASSHPDGQSILTPGSAIGFLEGIAEQINSIFSSG